MVEQSIIDEIEAAASKLGIAPSTLCERAVGNSRLLKRLQEGQSVTVTVLNRFRGYVAEQLASAEQSRSAA